MSIEGARPLEDLREEAELLVSRLGALSSQGPVGVRAALERAFVALREELSSEEVPPVAERVGCSLGGVLSALPEVGAWGELREVLARLRALYGSLPEGYDWAWESRPGRRGDQRRAARVWEGRRFEYRVSRRFHTGALEVASVCPGEAPGGDGCGFAGVLWALSRRAWAVLGRRGDGEGFDGLVARATRVAGVLDDAGVVLASADLNDPRSRALLERASEEDGAVALLLEAEGDLGMVSGYLRDEAGFIYEERDGDHEHVADPVSIAFLLGESELDPAMAVLSLRVGGLAVAYPGLEGVVGVYGVRLPGPLSG